MRKNLYEGNCFTVNLIDSDCIEVKDENDGERVAIPRPEFLRALRAVFHSLTLEEQIEITGKTETR